MKRQELIKAYIDFFKSKKHKEIKNSSLIPENDPTVLFTTAGMHPLVAFLLGQKHPQGKRLVNVQKCIRTGDIDEVGDGTHHTFFEMLGNWSLGDYWKKESINYSYEFLTNILKIPKEKISVTCFKGIKEKNVPRDIEAEKTWKKLGIKKIKFLGKKDNWWGPAGKTGPCGPDTEIFINDVEIWNNVFMEYNKEKSGKYSEAKQKNIDTGMGVERTLAMMKGIKDNYLTECFKPIIKKIEELSKKQYDKNKKTMRIIADHVKSAVFIVNDGVSPGNKEQGYVLRRLIRRSVKYGMELGIRKFVKDIAHSIFVIYTDYNFDKKRILEELIVEEEKFLKTLEKGLNKFKKLTKDKKELSGKDAFLLYQSFGFPVEMIEEECKKEKIKFSIKEYEKYLEGHKKLSQTASSGKYKSGLADSSEATTKLHTATHLLLESLKKILKDKSIIQRGSNITPKRLRFDFNFPRKVEKDELKEIEDLVNKKIEEGLKITKEEMSPEKAKEKGAIGTFGAKYGERVSVYKINNFSKEICTGPHVENTKELGHFKIIKEESSSSGVRRIKAILE